MSNDNAIYRGEAWCKRWGDSSAGGRTVTLQLDDEGDHPFRGYEGERFAVVIVPIGNDDKPMVKASSPQAAGGLARAAALSPDERSAIASKAARRRWKDMPHSQRAALRIKEPEFWNYITSARGVVCADEAGADTWLKFILDVDSKSKITGPVAHHFYLIDGKFQAWQQAKGHNQL